MNNRFLDETMKQTLQGLRSLEAQHNTLAQRYVLENDDTIAKQVYEYKQRIDALRRSICEEVEMYLKGKG